MTTGTNWFKPFEEDEPEDFNRPRFGRVEVGPPAHDPKATAAAIIRAGRLRRGEIVEDVSPPVGSLGAAILAAAAKARGEQVKK